MLPLFLALRRFDAAFLVFILGMIASFSSISPSEALQHYAAILGAPAGAGVAVASGVAATAAAAGFAGADVAVGPDTAGLAAGGFATGTTFFFGATIITMRRPSILGNCSTTQISSVSSLIRSSCLTPNS